MFIIKSNQLITTLLIGLLLLGAKSLNAKDESLVQSIDPLVQTEVTYLFESEAELTLKEVTSPYMQSQFQEPGTTGLSFGWVDQPLWVKIKVKPPFPEKRLYLIVAWPLLDDISLHMLNKNGKVVSYHQAGDHYPFNKREIFDSNYVFSIPFDTGNIRTLYFRIKTTSSMQLPFSFISEQRYLKERAYHQTGQGFFYGLMAIMIFYSLFLYFSTRRLAYLHYVLFVASFTLLQAGLKGVGFQFVWPNLPALNDYAVATAGALSLLFLNLFARTFLQIQSEKTLVKINNVFLVIAGIFIFASLVLPYTWVIKPLAVSVIVSAFVVIGMAVYRYKQGFREARFYLLAWVAMVIGSVTYLFKQLGFLPVNLFTENSMQIGAGLEMLLLSLALADRLNTLRSELESTNLNLEKQVEDRTLELREAMENLEAANLVLEELSATDKLTGLKNRHHFDTTLSLELNRIKRNNDYLSLLLIDIDHFKSVNDTWGHVVGDRALRFVSDCLRKVVRRDIDKICRYGGEEFAIILPTTPKEGALAVAESIRRSVDSNDFVDQGNKFSITISVGVATTTQDINCNLEELIRAADIALYNAKSDGRNCTHLFLGDIKNDVDYDKKLSERFELEKLN
ncbi:MAG: GGDEF domain-containing protein [Gammaproteobacteria bacterium]|nr:GGDEF domain-containing protein [Gammaproteobacteria bacterium]